jgi:ABC-2 type transport system permease protein
MAGHPTRATMLWAQVVTAARAAGRDPWSLVFAVAMPTLLVLLLPAVFGTEEMPWLDDIRFPQFYAPAMAVYGIAVHAFVNVPEGLAAARERGVLKRLRGTPLPPSVFVGGRLGGIVLVGLGICVLTFGVGVVAYDVEVGLARLPVLLVTFLVGTLAIAALGLLVASVVPSTASVPVVALGILLPLEFVSDIFLLGDVPPVVAWIGWTFPLKHFVYAMVAAADPAATAGGWAELHLGVLLAWGAVGAALAIRWFRWEPARRATRTRESSHPKPDDA